MAKGAQSHEIRLYYGIHKSCFVEEATEVKIELEESTFRACFPSIVRDHHLLFALRPIFSLEAYFRHPPILNTAS